MKKILFLAMLALFVLASCTTRYIMVIAPKGTASTSSTTVSTTRVVNTGQRTVLSNTQQPQRRVVVNGSFSLVRGPYGTYTTISGGVSMNTVTQYGNYNPYATQYYNPTLRYDQYGRLYSPTARLAWYYTR